VIGLLAGWIEVKEAEQAPTQKPKQLLKIARKIWMAQIWAS
jgi:hypothetical protein